MVKWIVILEKENLIKNGRVAIIARGDLLKIDIEGVAVHHDKKELIGKNIIGIGKLEIEE